jgi:hypothetical protein
MNQIPKRYYMSVITTLIIQTLTKKISDICPKPKKLYRVYKLYNAKQKKI